MTIWSCKTSTDSTVLRFWRSWDFRSSRTLTCLKRHIGSSSVRISGWTLFFLSLKIRTLTTWYSQNVLHRSFMTYWIELGYCSLKLSNRKSLIFSTRTTFSFVTRTPSTIGRTLSTGWSVWIVIMKLSLNICKKSIFPAVTSQVKIFKIRRESRVSKEYALFYTAVRKISTL